MPFKEVEAQPNFVEKEHTTWNYWLKQDIVNKYLKKNQGAEKKYFFLDGPVTANNPLGVHHAWGRSLKDLYQRFYNMSGYEERFQNGFDCQGLWVEVEVEKELGFKTKKDIETYGIDKFVEKCKERVMKYSEIQADQSKRLGYFMDWDHSYYTMSDENNYMIWHFLKVCHERGWLYKGWDSVPWCPRCGTAISQHEILTEEYKELKHQSVFVRLKIKHSTVDSLQSAFLLVWTTTPWTLPANVAVAIHPDLKYGLYEHQETHEKFIFIDDSETSEMQFLQQNFDLQNFKKVQTLLGAELVGTEYEGMFDNLPAVQKAKSKQPNLWHTVIPAKDFVTANEGTGMVHIAPGCGKEDYDLSVKENFAQIIPINSEAYYEEGFDFLTGKNVKQVNDLIFDHLKQHGNFHLVKNYQHRYPTCWRCKQELVFRLVEEWYIAMDRKAEQSSHVKMNRFQNLTLREQMIEVAKEIKWIPEFGLDRELDWLNNMHDWLISKKRYWGLALPIWKCDSCGEITVVGSKEELKDRASQNWEQFDGHSPHRPWIDSVKLKCEKCSSTMTRILDVGNPWLDAGIVPYSTLVDPKTNKVSYTDDKAYWQKWFPADLVLECFPGQFKNWFYSMIAMSTVLEQSAPYITLLGHSLVKDEKGAEMHKSSGNAIWLDEASEKMGVDVMRWMYALQPTVQNMKFGYTIADETRRRFHLIIWNVYKFFVTYAGIDNWEPSKEKSAENSQQLTILDRWILERLDQTVFSATESIKNYQAYLAAQAIEEFVSDLSTWYLRRSRKRVGVGADEVQDKHAFYATMHQVLTVLMRLIAPMVPFFADDIYRNLTGEPSVHLATWPIVEQEDVVTVLSKKMALVRRIVEVGHAQRKDNKMKVRQPLQSVKYFYEGEALPSEFTRLIEEELNVKEVLYEKKDDELQVELNLELTDELRAEGLYRELVRFAQEMRKELGCDFSDSINLYYQVNEPVMKVINQYQKELKKQIIAQNLLNERKDLPVKIDKTIEGNQIWLAIEKI